MSFNFDDDPPLVELKPVQLFVAWGRNRHATVIALHDPNPVEGKQGAVEFELEMAGWDIADTGLLDTDTPDDPGLYVWEGHAVENTIRYVEDVDWDWLEFPYFEGNEYKVVWKGKWRKATEDDLVLFADKCHVPETQWVRVALARRGIAKSLDDTQVTKQGEQR